MVIVMGTFRLPAENYAIALPMMQKVIAATRTEDGCMRYAYSRDLIDPEVMHVSEQWRDRAALDAHFQTPHMKVWIEERVNFGLNGRDIKVFESDDGVSL